MKDFIMLKILLLLLLPNFLYAQKKHDNSIVIPHFISAAKIKSVLFQQGWTFEQSTDTAFLFTKEKQITAAFRNQMKLSFFITDSSVYIKGTFKFTDDKMEFTEIKYAPLFKKGKQLDWDEMNRIAKLFSANVYYIRQ